MAQMAFKLNAVGVLGGVGDLVIGIKAPNIRIFSMTVFGATAFASAIYTRRPFTIRNDAILSTLTNEYVDFQAVGVHAMWGELSVGFKVYRADGTVGYDETRAAATYGSTLGGFARPMMRLSLVNPTSSYSAFLAGTLGLT